MIDAISISNFMRLKNCNNLKLGPITLLVGQNGSGKSSILKAIHWGVRCASLAENGKLSLDKMDFVPSVDFRSLAHRSTLQGRARDGNSKKPIELKFWDGINNGLIRIKATGNDAGVSVETDGVVAEELALEAPQTAYIPGLAGLSEHETILASPVFRRRAASGDGGSVLRQMMLNIHSDNMNTGDQDAELTELSDLVGQVIPGVRFWVKFDQRRDASIQAWFYTPDMKYESGASTFAAMRRPLEMAGTGLLQVTQIFAYLLVFQPRLLLVDEPDAHLHQTSQERLIAALQGALAQFPETQIVMSTHSSRLVRAANSATSVIWIDGGEVKDDGDSVRVRMGWGALDKDLVIFTEDEDISYLQAILDQWPHLSNRIALWPCFGVSSIPDGERLAKLRRQHGMKIVVHRDRDFMSDDDLTAWKEHRKLAQNDIPVWFSPGSDIESCYQDEDHLSKVMDISNDDAAKSLKYALDELDEDKVGGEFSEAYSGALKFVPGQVNVIKRWDDLGGFCKSTVKGKTFKAALRKGLQKRLCETGQARKLANLPSLYICHPDYVVSPDLRALIELEIAL